MLFTPFIPYLFTLVITALGILVLLSRADSLPDINKQFFHASAVRSHPIQLQPPLSTQSHSITGHPSITFASSYAMCLFIHRICGCGNTLMSSNTACTAPQGHGTYLELMELGCTQHLTPWAEDNPVQEHVTTIKRMYETRCICSATSNERASYAESARAADRNDIEAHKTSSSLVMLADAAMYLYTGNAVHKAEKMADGGVGVKIEPGVGPAHGVVKSSNAMVLVAACGCQVEREVYESVRPFEVAPPDQFECMEWQSRIHVGPMCRRCAMAGALERERQQIENTKVERDLTRAMANVGKLGLDQQSAESDVEMTIDSFNNFRM